jgi:integrase
MSIELTEAIIAAAPPGSRHWDSVVRGFGLEVYEGGVKTFLCQCETKDFAGRRQYKVRFGGDSIVLPDGTVFDRVHHADQRLWPLDYARQYARQWLAAVKAGRDPPLKGNPPLAVTMLTSKPGRLPKGDVPPAKSTKLEHVVERFVREHLRENCSPTYSNDATSLLRRLVVKRWKGRDINSITPVECYDLLNEFKAHLTAQGGTGAEANRLHAVTGKMFKWALNPGRALAQSNPFAGLDRIREVERDRALTDAELAAVWRSAELVLRYPWSQFVKLLILTGQRLREVGHMRWDNLDLEATPPTWTQPKNKARRPHVVPLSPQAVEVLLSCKTQAIGRQRGDFVFMSGIGVGRTRPVRGFWKIKERLDARCGVMDWRFHDLRRTCVSGMSRLRVPPHIKSLVVNHAVVGVTGKTYDRCDYLAEKKDALDKWAQHVVATAKRYPLTLTPEEKAAAAYRQAFLKAAPKNRRTKSLEEANALALAAMAEAVARRGQT